MVKGRNHVKETLVAVLLLSGLALAQEQPPPDSAPPVEPDAAAASAPDVVPSAAAEPVAEPAPEARPPSLQISLKVGGHFPQVVNKLGTSFDTSLSVGYAPFKGRQLQIFVGLGYTQPSQTISTSDPRLSTSGAEYTSTLVMRDLATTLGVQYFFLSPRRFLVPYAGAGFRVHFLRADVEGSGGAEFGKYNETDTRYGGMAFVGLGVHLGPGLLMAEVAFNYAPIRQRVSGLANVGAFAAVLGYGLLLF